MESKTKITFWINTSKKNSQNQVPVYVRVWNNYEHFSKSTGVRIKLHEWDKRSMRVKGNHDSAYIANKQLETLRVKIIQIVNKLTISGKPFNLETIRNHLEGREEGKITLLQTIDEQLKEMRKLIRKDYQPATLIKYDNTRLRIEQFLKAKFKRSDIFLYELDEMFMSDWIVFLKDKFNNSDTTCYKHFQRLRRFVRKAVKMGYLEKYPFGDFNIRLPKKKIEYLTQDEFDRIEQTDFKIERLNIIRDIFVFCCYTGLGYAEVESLTVDNITLGMDKELWLDIKRKKTKNSYQVPILKKAQEIIDRYKTHPKCIKKGKLLPVPSNVKYNAYLKEIASMAEINKTLTTHLARKSFATTILLTNGVNIAVLSKLLGHASVQVTLQAYAEIADELMMRNIKELKEKLDKQ
jgi:integrase